MVASKNCGPFIATKSDSRRREIFRQEKGLRQVYRNLSLFVARLSGSI
jgi:hypothetical protein